MIDGTKPDLTKSVVGRMIEAEKKELREEIDRLRAEQATRDAEQATRDAEQDAKLARRSSRAQNAIGAAEKFDFTVAHPKTSVVIGVALIVGSLVAHGMGKIDATPMYVLWGIAVCLIPGLAFTVVRLALGLRKAKGAA